MDAIGSLIGNQRFDTAGVCAHIGTSKIVPICLPVRLSCPLGGAQL